MKRTAYVLPVIIVIATAMVVGPITRGVTIAAAAPSLPSSVEVAVAYADTENRGPKAGTCGPSSYASNDACFPYPWCGSPGVQFIGASTNYNGNSTDPKNCEAGDWDTGAIMVMNKGTAPITLTNLTVTLPLPSSGQTVTPQCVAEKRPITFNVWFGQQYYWHNQKDPAFDGGPITVAQGGEAIFAGTSSDNSYQCPTGNYPSIGNVNGTYDFDTSDAYYIDGCIPTTDATSAPRIIFSATGFAPTAYNDTGHIIDTGGIDTGNCSSTSTDPQWGHEYLGWRLINVACGEGCPLNQLGQAASTSTSVSTQSQPLSSGSSTPSQASATSASSTPTLTQIGSTSLGGSGVGGPFTLYGFVAVGIVVVFGAAYLLRRRSKPR